MTILVRPASWRRARIRARFLGSSSTTSTVLVAYVSSLFATSGLAVATGQPGRDLVQHAEGLIEVQGLRQVVRRPGSQQRFDVTLVGVGTEHHHRNRRGRGFALSVRRTSSPEMSGRWTSSSTRCGGFDVARSRPSRPSATWTRRHPGRSWTTASMTRNWVRCPRCRARSRRHWSMSQGSLDRRTGARRHRRGVSGVERQRERRALADRGLESDLTVHQFDQGASDGEADPCPFDAGVPAPKRSTRRRVDRGGSGRSPDHRRSPRSTPTWA